MESFKILIKKSAADELAGDIPKRDLEKIVHCIRSLSEEPRPSGCRKLSSRNLYRLRQGDYRIVTAVDDIERLIEIFKIGHRRDIHRD